ncbi:ATP-dependent bile acid permease, putative [Talaromyces marneffei ATCC 18224]|uniref:ATP-dependent bile acid permease, putative n=1 Tax=Talaromyces marneffei (strain ATCC 18224 / CBS 334.59 / QM 7333) TaxID=441960 RepID=B6QN65_TALMQ|nr:ATP-dependent bile acid permease, putative [Talaromyces marneffei ATCC 18224]
MICTSTPRSNTTSSVGQRQYQVDENSGKKFPMASTDTCDDGGFGPVLGTMGCRGGFDFTLVFEASALTIIPAAFFLLLAPIRIFQLSRQSPKVHSSAIRIAILVLTVCLAAIQIVLLALVATQQPDRRLLSLAGAILEVFDMLCLVILVDLEYVRSIRPSFLVSAYLFVTLLLDVARVRTAWLLPNCLTYSICLSLSLAIKLLLICMENVEKRKWLVPSEKTKSDESLSGPFSRVSLDISYGLVGATVNVFVGIAANIIQLGLATWLLKTQVGAVCIVLVIVVIVNLPPIVGQLLTFAGYVIVAKVQSSGNLSISQAIISLSLINLLITPLYSLLLAIPDIFALIACLHRIQDFFNRTHRRDMRQFPQSVLASSTYLPGIELSLLPEPVSNTGTLSENQTDTILSMKNVDFRWEASPPDRTGVTLTLKSSPIGNLIAVIGPVGSGKSTFLKGLAGETLILRGDLFIKYPHLAFCEQTPWLANGTIRDNIITCGLDLDFKRMPAGDETLMGSNSAKLSGGQRQRVISFPVPSMILLGQDYIRGYIQGLETQSNQITEVEGSINSDNDRLEPPRIATGPLGTPAALYSRYYWLGLYGAFSVIEAIALSLAVFWIWVIIIPAASKNLYYSMLRAYISSGYASPTRHVNPGLAVLSTHILLITVTGLELVLNLIVAALAVILISATVALRSHVNPGLLGIALVMMIDLGQILAIAQIKKFAKDILNKDINTNIQTQESLTEWPDRGEIAFVNTSIGYSGVEQAKPIVNGLHLHISIGEKIGLCGRTGSGKSTLALSLLRLTELVSGRILIDGQDVTLISKSFLRQRVSCLSQEAFLFPGTIRQNADPLNNMTNTEIINALRCVELWDALVAIHGGNEEVVLDAKLNDSNLSHGQNLDTETDAKVQMVIRKSFRECTVIMVAHRIHILLDFDRVAVLDSGRVVEVGQPLELMLKPHGGFSKLLDLES